MGANLKSSSLQSKCPLSSKTHAFYLTRSRKVHLNLCKICFIYSREIGYPVPGETTLIDKSEKIDLDSPLDGGVLVKVVLLSIDPYLRGRMRDASIHSYLVGFIDHFQIIHLTNPK